MTEIHGPAEVRIPWEGHIAQVGSRTTTPYLEFKVDAGFSVTPQTLLRYFDLKRQMEAVNESRGKCPSVGTAAIIQGVSYLGMFSITKHSK